MRKFLICFLGLGLTAVTLSACGNLSTHHSTKLGSVVGNLVISPPFGNIVQTNGTVTFERRGSQHPYNTFDVSQSGRFTVEVPPGRWIVTGRSPKYGNGKYVCVTSGDLIVKAKHQVSVSVRCLEK